MLSKIVSAVDIGSSKICTVISSVDEENNSINVIGYGVVSSTGVKKGVIVNLNEALAAIQESLSSAEKMAGVSISEVLVSINGRNIFSNNTKGVVAVTGNEIVDDDIGRVLESVKTIAVPPQLRRIVHIIPRQYIVDSQPGIKQPKGMSGSRLEVDAHVVSALSTVIYNIEKVFGEISINAIPVFAGLASTQAVATNTEKELGVVVLDIGHSTATITIYQDDALTYNSCINLGGQSITNDLAVGLQIQSEDAEKLKRNIGNFLKDTNKESQTAGSNTLPAFLKTDHHTYDGGDEDLIDISSLQIPNLLRVSKKIFEEIVDCRLEEIFNLVSSNVSSAGFSVRQPSGIVITGGGAKLYGITKKASKFFGVPCRVGYPQGLTGPLIDEISSTEFACVQGLILLYNDMLMNDYSLWYRDNTTNNKGLIEKIMSFFKNVMS